MTDNLSNIPYNYRYDTLDTILSQFCLDTNLSTFDVLSHANYTEAMPSFEPMLGWQNRKMEHQMKLMLGITRAAFMRISELDRLVTSLTSKVGTLEDEVAELRVSCDFK